MAASERSPLMGARRLGVLQARAKSRMPSATVVSSRPNSEAIAAA